MHCKNCVFWSYDGSCESVDVSESKAELKALKDVSSSHLVVDVHVADNHGLSVKLRTGPDFGCVRFDPRKD